MAESSGAGVEVAPGDPGSLYGAAQFHSTLAETLSSHGYAIAGAATASAAVWNGEAAASYQALSGMVAAHFWNAAGISRTAAAALRRYASELERLQQDGMHALHEAEHWLNEVHTWTTKLDQANKAVTDAQRAVNSAQSALSSAHPGSPAATAAAGRLRDAEGQLHRAQSEQRTAQRELHDAQHQLTSWQRRGAHDWQQAQAAAMRATGELEPLTIAPPPLAGPVLPLSNLPGPTPPPASTNPLEQWLNNPPFHVSPNKNVTNPNPRNHHCEPGSIYLPYFGCKGNPPKFPPPPPPPPPHPSPGCGGGINLPLLGCIQPPSLPSIPNLPPLPSPPPFPLPVPAP